MQAHPLVYQAVHPSRARPTRPAHGPCRRVPAAHPCRLAGCLPERRFTAGAAGSPPVAVVASGQPVRMDCASTAARHSSTHRGTDRRRARHALRRRDGTLAAVRRALRHQGQHRRRGLAHHRCLRGLVEGRHHQRHGGAAPARCRCGVARQDQSRPVRHRPRRHAFTLWRASFGTRTRARQRWFEFGFGSRRGPWRGGFRAGHRHRRLGPRAGRLQRLGRHQAHAGAREHRGRVAGLPQPGLCLGLRVDDGRRSGRARHDRRRG